MDGHTTTRRLGAVAAPLVALVVLCFLCVLCDPGGASAGEAGPGTSVERVASSDVPDEQVASSDVPDEQGYAHACPTPDEQGLLTAHPLLALGSVPVLRLPLAPRSESCARSPHREPAPPHGHHLLTLLCVQRV
jgi:hypothetical protein